MSNDLSNTGNINILLVENSKTARAILVSLLRNLGYDVKAVATGPHALDHLEKHHTDLVLLDVFMPLMNGYELADRIRSSQAPYAQVPIIAYTSSASSRDRELCMNAGINEYLIKSEDNAELISVLSNY